MLPVVVVILVVGLGAVAAGLALFLGFGFERFVGVRYLQRSRGSRAGRIGLWLALALTAGSLAAFAAARGHDGRQIETVAVVFSLLGALMVILLLLLRMFSVFTTVAAMGVVLGVASLVVVLAVTSGFEREFQDKVLGVNGHLIVTDYALEQDPIEAEHKADEYMGKLRGMPGVVRMSKFSFSAGEVMIGKVGANLKGIDLSDAAPELSRALVSGAIKDLGRPARCAQDDNPAGRLLLGAELARKLHTGAGQCVPVLVPFPRGEEAGPPRAFWFKVVGVFQMGFNEYDARLGFVPLEDARRLANARQAIFGVEVRFADPMMALHVQDEVERRLGPEPRLMNWRDLNHNLFMALTMQKLIIALVLGFIIVVAAFNIVASLMLVVLSKVREIAILGAMGARRASVLRVFLVAGSFVGFVGTGFGLLFGLTVVALARLYGYPLDPKVYLIAQLPVEVSVPELLFVASATQLICFVATLYPAARAARLRVLDGLRYT